MPTEKINVSLIHFSICNRFPLVVICLGMNIKPNKYYLNLKLYESNYFRATSCRLSTWYWFLNLLLMLQAGQLANMILFSVCRQWHSNRVLVCRPFRQSSTQFTTSSRRVTLHLGCALNTQPQPTAITILTNRWPQSNSYHVFVSFLYVMHR